MNWVHLISDELPRLRLYASAALGRPADGDLAVEAALGELFELHLATPVARMMAFSLLDRQLRRRSDMLAGDRTELLRHICGFTSEDALSIVQWESDGTLRSAG